MSYGRLKIYSDAKEITAQNVVDEVNKAYALHVQNRSDINKLWEYRAPIILMGALFFALNSKKLLHFLSKSSILNR